MPTTPTADDNDDHESTAVGEKAAEALSALHDGDLDEAAELLEEIAATVTNKTERPTPKTGTRMLSSVLNSFDTIHTPDSDRTAGRCRPPDGWERGRHRVGATILSKNGGLCR